MWPAYLSGQERPWEHAVSRSPNRNRTCSQTWIGSGQTHAAMTVLLGLPGSSPALRERPLAPRATASPESNEPSDAEAKDGSETGSDNEVGDRASLP